MAQCCEKKARGLLTTCDSRECLPLPTFESGRLDTSERFLYECLSPVPNPCYFLRILPTFFMMALFPICVMDLDSFIQQIFVENLSFSILAKCQLLPNLVISALFFLPCSSIPDSFVLPPFPRSQFQVICSRNKKLAGVAEDTNLGSFCQKKNLAYLSEFSRAQNSESLKKKKKILKTPLYYYYL